MTPTREWLASSPEEQGMDPAALARVVAFGASNAMDSLTVVRNDRIVLDATFSPFRPGLRHRMYSTTKSVVGTLVAIAVSEGRIDSVDRRMVDFFPGLAIANLDDRKKAITVRHLLDMTSGLQWDEPLGGLPASVFAMERSADWRQFALDRPMAAEPGSRFCYNSGASHLLSAILGQATGMSTLDYARAKLFAPLGIDDATWQADPQGITIGGYGLHLQPRDMAKLGRLWLRNGRWDGRQIVPAALIDAVRQATVVAMPETGSDIVRYSHHFWSVPSKGSFMAMGLHHQLIIVIPALDMVIVATSAARHTGTGMPIAPQYDSGTVIAGIRSAVTSDEPLPHDATATAALAAAVEAATIERPTAAGGTSETAKLVSGRTFRFPANAYRLKSVRFDLGGDGMSYAFELAHIPGKFGGPIGFDGLYRIGGRPSGRLNAAKGRWLDENTLAIEAQSLGNDDAARVTYAFGDKTVDMTYEDAGFFRFTLQGRAED